MILNEVIPLGDHQLFVETQDGIEGVFDLKPYLKSEAFLPLKDEEEFSSVHNGGYFVEWPCGADLSADTIQARMRSASPAIAQQARKPDRQLATQALVLSRYSQRGRDTWPSLSFSSHSVLGWPSW